MSIYTPELEIRNVRQNSVTMFHHFPGLEMSIYTPISGCLQI